LVAALAAEVRGPPPGADAVVGVRWTPAENPAAAVATGR
jgi:hypothetical protein